MDDTKTIRVLSVDDHEIMRGGIRYLLLALDDIELVGEASSGDEALGQCEVLQPDVILMDMRMPGLDGIQTTRLIRESYPDIQILALTSFEEQPTLSPEAFNVLVHSSAAEPQKPDFDLTEREQQVLATLVQGLSNPEIANRLVISEATVKYHVTNILRKLGAANRTEAAAMAVQSGLVSKA